MHVTPSRACVDAVLVVAVLVPEEMTAPAGALWQSWLRGRVERVAPPLFFAEVTSVLRLHVCQGSITVAQGERAFAAFLRMNVRNVTPPDLQQRAWALAKRYNRPRAYDAQYLAMADFLGGELWTLDQRLANAVREPWLRLVR